MLIKRDVTVPPAQVPPTVTLARVIPTGKSSLKVAPVSATALPFAILNVMLVAPPTPIDFGAANAFVNVGAANTSRLPDAVVPVPAFVVVTAPLEFVRVPAVELVTSTEIAQLDPATMLPPVSESEEPFATAVTVPPQLLETPGDAVLKRNAG